MTSYEFTGSQLHLDCFAGIAGDMFLGALLDLGVPERWLREQLAGLGLDGYELHIGTRKHHSIIGCDVRVEVSDEAHTAHRPYQQIQQLIGRSELPEGAKTTALAIFEQVGQAEARVHGVPLAEVTFHEVGAVDSIVDIVGAALALEYLKPARVSARAVPLGSGFTRGAHGVMPVPSPAAVEILSGMRGAGAVVEQGPEGLELCTPTGAAIVATVVREFCPLPRGRLIAVGYGAGDCSLADRPNHLRAMLLANEPTAERCAEEMVLIETNLDDMTAELAGHLLERLLAAGARDVWHTPITMKKGRPATQIAALCDASLRQQIAGVMLLESTAIGVRCISVQRTALDRRLVEVATTYGPLLVKEAHDGDAVLNAAPEYESCRAAAERSGVPLKRIYAAAVAAYWSQERHRGGGGQPSSLEDSS